jgi:hypothetical protein
VTPLRVLLRRLLGRLRGAGLLGVDRLLLGGLGLAGLTGDGAGLRLARDGLIGLRRLQTRVLLGSLLRVGGLLVLLGLLLVGHAILLEDMG